MISENHFNGPHNNLVVLALRNGDFVSITFGSRQHLHKHCLLITVLWLIKALQYIMCCCVLLTLIFIFRIAWIFITERYDSTHLSEATQRSHIYQQQVSVNSSTSIQTVIFNPNQMSSGDEVDHLNASESLSSILTRSSNEGQRQKTLSVSSADEPLHIDDVADLLHSQYAIISGGRSMDTGSPLITFPDHNNFQLLGDRDYQRLVQYLIGVTSLQDADLGFQLIIDRRKSSWASVKAVLLKISVS